MKKNIDEFVKELDHIKLHTPNVYEIIMHTIRCVKRSCDICGKIETTLERVEREKIKPSWIEITDGVVTDGWDFD